MDDVEVSKIVSFEAAMQSHLKSANADLLNRINETADYNDEIAAEMKAAIEAFKANGVW
jgi:F-type H+-transporting ATPase subunit alpha